RPSPASRSILANSAPPIPSHFGGRITHRAASAIRLLQLPASLLGRPARQSMRAAIHSRGGSGAVTDTLVLTPFDLNCRRSCHTPLENLRSENECCLVRRFLCQAAKMNADEAARIERVVIVQ